MRCWPLCLLRAALCQDVGAGFPLFRQFFGPKIPLSMLKSAIIRDYLLFTTHKLKSWGIITNPAFCSAWTTYEREERDVAQILFWKLLFSTKERGAQMMQKSGLNPVKNTLKGNIANISYVVRKLIAGRLMWTASTEGRESEIWGIINKQRRFDHRACCYCCWVLLLAARQSDKSFHSSLHSLSVSWGKMTFSWLCLWLLCCNNVWHFIPNMMCQTSLQLRYGGI